MNESTKELILIFSMVIFFSMCIATNTYAWSIMPNYQYYSNVTVSSWHGSFPFNSVFSFNTGNTFYVYVNTTSNTLLKTTPIQYLTISGYDKYGDLIGNVTAFPFPSGNGLLISNTTVSGLRYTFLTIWFGQFVQTPTYLSNYTAQNVSVYPNRFSPLINSSSSQIALQLVEFITHKNQFNSVFNYKYPNSANLSGIVSTFFNGTSPYLFLTYTPGLNISLAYVPHQIFTDAYNYSVTKNIDKLSTLGFTGSTLTSNNLNPILIYLNPIGNPYQLLSQSSGINSSVASCSGCIFNSIQSSSPGIGFFNQPNHAQYQLNIFTPNSTVGFSLTPEFFMIPAYTTSYSSTYNTITNPIVPALTCGFTFSNWYCFQNRILVNVTSWDYNFTSYVIPPSKTYSSGALYGKNTIVFNASYLQLQIPHYPQIGSSCTNVYFEGVSNSLADEGQIPFSVYNCSTSTGTFVLSDETNQSIIYNNFYIYFNSNTSLPSFSNSILLNQWTQTGSGSGAGFSFSNKYNWSVSLSSPLSKLSFLGLSFNTGNYLGFNGSSSGNTRSVTFSTGGSKSVFYYNSIFGGETNFVFYNGIVATVPTLTMIGEGVSDQYQETSGGSVSIYSYPINAFTSSGVNYVPVPGSYTLNVSDSVTVKQLYSTSYILGGVQFFSSFHGNNTVPGLPLPPTNSSPVTNTIVSGLNFSLTHYNQSMSALNLTSNTVLLGLVVPKYYTGIILLIAFLLIVLLTHDEISLMLGILVIWFIGIFNIQALPLALLCTLIYSVYNYVHTHEKRR